MKKRPSIRAYLLAMNFLLLFVLFPAFGLMVLRETVQFRDAQLSRNIRMIQQALASRSAAQIRQTAAGAGEAVAGLDLSFLQDLIVRVAGDDPDIAFCMVMNRQGMVAAHNEIGRIGALPGAPEDTRAVALMGEVFSKTRLERSPEVRFFWDEGGGNGEADAMEAVFPVYSGDALWGVIRIGYSLATLNREIIQTREDWADQIRQLKLTLIGMLVTFSAIGLVAAMLLTRAFVRGTGALHDGVRRVAAGDLRHGIEIPGMVCEEFVVLADSFNTMTDKLRLSIQQLDDYSKSLEDKVDERTKELRATQEVLLEQAHEAGMAEMAVGVLHNIGNAITPAKVGASVLLGRLRNSPLRTRLASSLAPLRAHLEDGRALSPEESQRLAEILRYLPTSISEEFDRAVEELENISTKHGHIENIIDLQMRYARLTDNPNLVEVNRVIRDAVKMLADAIDRRGITLTLDLAELPPVRMEETRLLQVLVNLLKNGYEAMDGMSTGSRNLQVTSALETEPRPMVRIAIRDSGCGFDEKERGRLFSYGYSTKKRGSGFGLHSCANYLIANHGSIETKSDGPGLGAEFIIRLPAHSQKTGKETEGNQ